MSKLYMPIALTMNGRSCLVVGGGRVALRKVENLLEYDGVKVTVVSPEVVDKVQYFADRKMIDLRLRPYKSPEALDYALVISASNDEAVNKLVYDECHLHNIPVNVVDNPPLCDIIFPAVIRRDCLSVAVSTDGKAPFMSAHLKIILDTIFPEHWNRLMALAADFRIRVQQTWPDDFEKRTLCYERFVNADWKSMLQEVDSVELDHEMASMLEM